MTSPIPRRNSSRFRRCSADPGADDRGLDALSPRSGVLANLTYATREIGERMDGTGAIRFVKGRAAVRSASSSMP
jgi:hypothetical protein